MAHKFELQLLQCEIPSYAQLMPIHLLLFLTCETEVCIPIKSNFPLSHSAIFSNTNTLNHGIIYVAKNRKRSTSPIHWRAHFRIRAGGLGPCQECFEFYFLNFFKHQISSIWISKPELSVHDTRFMYTFLLFFDGTSLLETRFHSLNTENTILKNSHQFLLKFYHTRIVLGTT